MIKLRRIVSSESWIPEIDGLRCVAIMAVVLMHLMGESLERGPRLLAPHLPYMQWVLGNGDRGVALFFVISGFVLARPFYAQHRLQQRKVRLRQYYLRRLTRLEPPYLLALLLAMLSWVLVVHTPVHYAVHHTLISALYMHNLAYPASLPFPIFVTWSLEVEVQFYILAPLIGQIYRIQSRSRRRTVWLLFILVSCVWGSTHTNPPYTILSGLAFFLAGFLLADFFDDPLRPTASSYLWDVLGLVGWVLIFTLPRAPALYGWFPWLIMPVYATAFYGKVSRWLFSRPLLFTIGGMCYSLYLTHVMVMSFAFRAVKRLSFANDSVTLLVQMAGMLVPVMLVGLVYFVLIERPCMKKRWPQELMARLRRA
jgi:peptidoglycan/LPS O-acetylase OafA/YrhL